MKEWISSSSPSQLPIPVSLPSPPLPSPLSQCNNASVSTVTLHDSTVKALRGDGPVHHMILGPACTVATEPVAECSGKYLKYELCCETLCGCRHTENNTLF